MNALEISSLTKKFKKSVAIDNISLNVEEGEIFGFLGPNGAGKSTTMMILTTLLKPTSGNASVCGFDVVTSPSKVRQNIGFVQQDIGIDEYLTARENLQFQCKISHIPKEQIKIRIEEVLDLVELKEKQDEQSITFSGGMRKRLDIACGLIHRPKVLFLDEPTVGLDIQTRRKIWEYIRKIHKEFGMTLFVSTHYMEEADSLCDRVGIIDYGKIQIVDTPQSMKKKLETDMITFSVIPDKVKKEQFIKKLKTLDLIKNVNINETTMTVQSSDSTQVIPKIFQISSEIGLGIDSFVLNKPTLDDVFISYTGRNLRDETNGKFNKRKEYNQSKRRGL
jgi:ABC-2 type transport system ATP-binding protein|tara:strand:- start:2547 stop:3551 length:1005 start_codon:yes stop_codon:yes gene_type:complete